MYYMFSIVGRINIIHRVITTDSKPKLFCKDHEYFTLNPLALQFVYLEESRVDCS